MSVVTTILTIFFLVAGLFFMLVAALGVVRMPDLYTRMHAATKASTLGISGIALAALIYLGDYTATTRVILIILFFFLTAPVGAHALAGAAYVTGQELWPRTRRFDLDKAHILCPLRGGLASQKLVEKAVQLAHENRGQLTFVHIINQRLVEVAHDPSEAAKVLSELRALGETVVATAQAQANAKGVMAHGAVRVGTLEEELINVAQEIAPTHILLGYPEQRSAAEQKVAEDQVWALAAVLQEKSTAQVLVVR